MQVAFSTTASVASALGSTNSENTTTTPAFAPTTFFSIHEGKAAHHSIRSISNSNVHNNNSVPSMITNNTTTTISLTSKHLLTQTATTTTEAAEPSEGAESAFMDNNTSTITTTSNTMEEGNNRSTSRNKRPSSSSRRPVMTANSDRDDGQPPGITSSLAVTTTTTSEGDADGGGANATSSAVMATSGQELWDGDDDYGGGAVMGKVSDEAIGRNNNTHFSGSASKKILSDDVTATGSGGGYPITEGLTSTMEQSMVPTQNRSGTMAADIEGTGASPTYRTLMKSINLNHSGLPRYLSFVDGCDEAGEATAAAAGGGPGGESPSTKTDRAARNMTVLFQFYLGSFGGPLSWILEHLLMQQPPSLQNSGDGIVATTTAATEDDDGPAIRRKFVFVFSQIVLGVVYCATTIAAGASTVAAGQTWVPTVVSAIGAAIVIMSLMMVWYRRTVSGSFYFAVVFLQTTVMIFWIGSSSNVVSELTVLCLAELVVVLPLFMCSSDHGLLIASAAVAFVTSVVSVGATTLFSPSMGRVLLLDDAPSMRTLPPVSAVVFSVIGVLNLSMLFAIAEVLRRSGQDAVHAAMVIEEITKYLVQYNTEGAKKCFAQYAATTRSITAVALPLTLLHNDKAARRGSVAATGNATSTRAVVFVDEKPTNGAPRRRASASIAAENNSNSNNSNSNQPQHRRENNTSELGTENVGGSSSSSQQQTIGARRLPLSIEKSIFTLIHRLEQYHPFLPHNVLAVEDDDNVDDEEGAQQASRVSPLEPEGCDGGGYADAAKEGATGSMLPAVTTSSTLLDRSARDNSKSSGDSASSNRVKGDGRQSNAKDGKFNTVGGSTVRLLGGGEDFNRVSPTTTSSRRDESQPNQKRRLLQSSLSSPSDVHPRHRRGGAEGRDAAGSNSSGSKLFQHHRSGTGNDTVSFMTSSNKGLVSGSSAPIKSPTTRVAMDGTSVYEDTIEMPLEILPRSPMTVVTAVTEVCPGRMDSQGGVDKKRTGTNNKDDTSTGTRPAVDIIGASWSMRPMDSDALMLVVGEGGSEGDLPCSPVVAAAVATNALPPPPAAAAPSSSIRPLLPFSNAAVYDDKDTDEIDLDEEELTSVQFPAAGNNNAQNHNSNSNNNLSSKSTSVSQRLEGSGPPLSGGGSIMHDNASSTRTFGESALAPRWQHLVPQTSHESDDPNLYMNQSTTAAVASDSAVAAPFRCIDLAVVDITCDLRNIIGGSLMFHSSHAVDTLLPLIVSEVGTFQGVIELLTLRRVVVSFGRPCSACTNQEMAVKLAAALCASVGRYLMALERDVMTASVSSAVLLSSSSSTNGGLKTTPDAPPPLTQHNPVQWQITMQYGRGWMCTAGGTRKFNFVGGEVWGRLMAMQSLYSVHGNGIYITQIMDDSDFGELARCVAIDCIVLPDDYLTRRASSLKLYAKALSALAASGSQRRSSSSASGQMIPPSPLVRDKSNCGDDVNRADLKHSLLSDSEDDGALSTSSRKRVSREVLYSVVIVDPASSSFFAQQRHRKGSCSSSTAASLFELTPRANSAMNRLFLRIASGWGVDSALSELESVPSRHAVGSRMEWLRGVIARRAARNEIYALQPLGWLCESDLARNQLHETATLRPGVYSELHSSSSTQQLKTGDHHASFATTVTTASSECTSPTASSASPLAYGDRQSNLQRVRESLAQRRNQQHQQPPSQQQQSEDVDNPDEECEGALFEMFLPSIDARDEDEISSYITDNHGRRWHRGKRTFGKGAYGYVFSAVGDFGVPVAVKCLDLESRSISASAEEVSQEIHTLSSLRHENIVGYIGDCLQGQYYYIFMECVPGGSLARMLEQFGKIPRAAVARYVRDALLGLLYLHSNSVVHCDIKPANILITGAGRCKLSDFGSAINTTIPTSKRANHSVDIASGEQQQQQQQEANASFEEEYKPIGTAAYMAPEACQGTTESASDVWSLGITLVELLTGFVPYSQPMGDPFRFITKVAKGDVAPDLSCLSRDKEAYSFASWCLRANPAERPAVESLLKHKFLTRNTQTTRTNVLRSATTITR